MLKNTSAEKRRVAEALAIKCFIVGLLFSRPFCRARRDCSLPGGVLKYAWVMARYRTRTYVFEISELAEACEPMGSDRDWRRGCAFHRAVDKKAAVFAYGVRARGYLGRTFPGRNAGLE